MNSVVRRARGWGQVERGYDKERQVRRVCPARQPKRKLAPYDGLGEHLHRTWGGHFATETYSQQVQVNV